MTVNSNTQQQAHAASSGGWDLTFRDVLFGLQFVKYTYLEQQDFFKQGLNLTGIRHGVARTTRKYSGGHIGHGIRLHTQARKMLRFDAVMKIALQPGYNHRLSLVHSNTYKAALRRMRRI